MAATSTLKKAFNIAGNILFTILLLFLVVMVFFVVKGKMEGGTPSIAGHKLYIVLSGSMSPTFDTGSVVGVKPVNPSRVVKGDIITFKDPTEPEKIVTHRVIDVSRKGGAISFITQGDANSTRDAEPVPASNVIGRVNWSVPYIGFLMEFAKTKRGLLTMVIVPGMAIIGIELRNLFRYANELEKEEEENKKFQAMSGHGAEAHQPGGE